MCAFTLNWQWMGPHFITQGRKFNHFVPSHHELWLYTNIHGTINIPPCLERIAYSVQSPFFFQRQSQNVPFFRMKICLTLGRSTCDHLFFSLIIYPPPLLSMFRMIKYCLYVDICHWKAPRHCIACQSVHLWRWKKKVFIVVCPLCLELWLCADTHGKMKKCPSTWRKEESKFVV